MGFRLREHFTFKIEPNCNKLNCIKLNCIKLNCIDSDLILHFWLHPNLTS